jgi:WD40 repeat protein
MTPLSGATTEIFAVSGQDTTRLCRLPWRDEIPRVAIFNPTGETIFVGLSQPSATIQQIDVVSCEVMREFVGHQDNVTDLALHPNGEILASVSLDGTALMWDIATGEMLSELSNNGQPINRIMFSEDGTHFFIADDNSISEWEFIDDASLLAWASGTAEVSPLTCEQRQQYAIPPLCESNE